MKDTNKDMTNEETMEELNLEEMEQTTGGIASLRDAPTQPVRDISDDIKSRI